MEHQNSSEERLQRRFDLYKIIYTDHYIEKAEEQLILKYAIGLGCSVEKARSVIEKSIKIFEGGLAFEDYRYVLDK